MGNFWKSSKLNTVILSCTISAFTLSTITPVHATLPKIGLNLNDIEFAVRIEKLIEKVNRYLEKNDNKKLMEVMFDIKMEVEGYTGEKINIEKTLDQVEINVKANGGKVDKRVMRQLKKNFKHCERKSNHKAMYMANCMEFDLPYSDEEELLLFQNELLMAKHSHDEDEDEEVLIPLRVTIGVTVMLCGFFLLFVPIPICRKSAPILIETGFGLLADEGITQYADKDKEKKDKK